MTWHIYSKTIDTKETMETLLFSISSRKRHLLLKINDKSMINDNITKKKPKNISDCNFSGSNNEDFFLFIRHGSRQSAGPIF